MARNLYVGRSLEEYEIRTRKSGWKSQSCVCSDSDCPGEWYFTGGSEEGFCVDDFERLTGIKLKVGQLARIKVELVEIIK